MLIFSATSMSLASNQINLIDVNFHLQKRFEIFDKNSADKIWPKEDKGVESALPLSHQLGLSTNNLIDDDLTLNVLDICNWSFQNQNKKK